MNPEYILIVFLSTVVYFITMLVVMGYFGLPTKYYYIIIANYTFLALYYYYKYRYYNLDRVVELQTKE